MPIFVPHGPESLISAQAIAKLVSRAPAVFLYIGPDQIMPLASVLSAIAAVALMFWRRIVGFVAMCLGVFRRRPPTSEGKPPIEDRA
ncbi:MAG TPA: hypothetical protein VES67_15465 [Vicinamibacterales bacterium]|nr:hypothetical protein [Vicinamibacterales bacterium]